MIKQKVGAIIQARMGSTRFPGKVAKKIYRNETILDLLLNRIKLSNKINEIIIATSNDEKNAFIIELAKAHNVLFFIGSEWNVLKRYYQAALKFEIEIIIRITSDCPFLDPYIMDEMLDFFCLNNYDYIRNVDGKTPYPIGFDIEIFSFKSLEKILKLAKTDYEKEHISPLFYKYPEIFSIFTYNETDVKVIDDLRLCVDYKEDLILLKEIYKKLKEKHKDIDFRFSDIIEIIEKDPKMMDINKKYKWREKAIK